MKSVLKVKLDTNKEQHRALWRTMNAFNQICNEFSELAHTKKIFNKVNLQRETYYQMREAHPEFSSQLIIRAIDVVSSTCELPHPQGVGLPSSITQR